MNRRKLLSMGVVLLSHCITGCQGNDDQPITSESETPTETVTEVETSAPPTNNQTALERPLNFEVRNNQESTHRYMIKIEYKDMEVIDVEFSLEPNSMKVFNNAVENVGTYTINVLLDGEITRTFEWDVDQYSHGGMLLFDDSGRLRFIQTVE